MPPAELLAAGRDEVMGYGGDIAFGTVPDIVRGGHGFIALLAGWTTDLRSARVGHDRPT